METIPGEFGLVLFEKALLRQDIAALVELAKLHETGTHGKANL